MFHQSKDWLRPFPFFLMQKDLYLVKVIEIDSEVQDAGYLIMLYGYTAKNFPRSSLGGNRQSL